jgi:hypothetical protein
MAAAQDRSHSAVCFQIAGRAATTIISLDLQEVETYKPIEMWRGALTRMFQAQGAVFRPPSDYSGRR